MNRYDVLVVGGGPAGSACAAVLARAGRSVAVLERERFPRDKICGDTLNPRAWPLLEEIGAAEELRSAPLAPIDTLRVFGRSGREARSPVSAPGGEPFVAVRRSVLDAVLLRAAARAGATIREETLLDGITPGEPLTVSFRGPAGRETASCRAIVGADGRNSTVARLTHATPRRAPADRRIGIQWYTEDEAGLAQEIRLYLLPFGYFGIVRLEGGAANLAMVLDARAAGTTGRNTGALIGLMRRANPSIDRTLADIAPVSPVRTTFPVTPSRALRSRWPVYLAGDARGVVEPFTGEGIYFALRDGVAAARQILSGRGAAARGSRLLVNGVVSPLLRHPRAAEAAVSLGSAAPLLARMASRAVARL